MKLPTTNTGVCSHHCSFTTEAGSQIAFNFTAIAIVGTIVERIFGTGRWVILYFVAGIIGQIAGLYWKPTGAARQSPEPDCWEL